MADIATRSTSRTAFAIAAGCLLIAACVALCAVQLRTADLSGVIAGAHPGWLLAACAATGVSLLAAAHNLTAFTPRRLRRLDTFRAQLAVCGLRVVAPSAISTPLVCARYLSRSGLGAAEAMAVVGTAQSAQLLMTVLLVALFAVFGAPAVDGPHAVDLGMWAAAAVALALVAGFAARRVPRVQRVVRACRHGLGDVLRHARRRPLTVVSGLGSSAALTMAHVGAFACCVAASGGHLSLFSATAIYLGAASAGSLIPTPAGIGAVEATMIGGLVAAGMSGGAATAAALLTRLITVWALVPPGWVAARSLRRRGLL